MTAQGLALRDVAVRLAGRRVVHPVTADLGTAGLIALVGPNGAGKTTLLRAMAGLLPHTGAITMSGTPLAAMTPGARGRHIGYLPQGHLTHWPLPVRDIVGLGRFVHGAHDPRRLSAADRRIVDEAMDRTGLTPLADRPATTLSGGERARLALARIIAQQAPVILADEPDAALDPRYQIEVMSLLRSLAMQGTLVVAITHDLVHAAHFADQVMVMDAGYLIRTGVPAEVLEEALLKNTFGIAPRRPLDGDSLPWVLT